MSRLGKHGLKLKAEKCILLKTEIHFLGHVISGDGIKTDPEKICVVKEWSPPTTLKGLRKFLGLTCYYRRFVPHYARLAAPLHQLIAELAGRGGKKHKKHNLDS